MNSSRSISRKVAADHRTGESILRGWWLYLPLVALGLLLVAFYYLPWWSIVELRHEHGLIERVQTVSITLAALVGFWMLWLPSVRSNVWLRAWVLCAALGCVYVAGEETSWGQHTFGWSTPEMMGEINGQNETNLHNVSVWFNGVPLTILELGVLIGGILIPLAALRRPAIRKSRFAVILPSIRGLPCATIVIAVRITKNVQVHLLGNEFPLGIKAGEWEELFLYAFILLYLVELRKRLIGADSFALSGSRDDAPRTIQREPTTAGAAFRA